MNTFNSIFIHFQSDFVELLLEYMRSHKFRNKNEFTQNCDLKCASSDNGEIFLDFCWLDIHLPRYEVSCKHFVLRMQIKTGRYYCY
jgi:hypothetical protein